MGARPFHPPTCLAREGLRTRVCRAMRGPMSLRPMTPSFSLHATQAQLVAACIALLAPVPRAVIAFTGGSGVVVRRPTLRSVAAFPPVSSSVAVGPAAPHLAKSDWRRGPNARSALHVLAMTAEGEVTGGQADGSEKKGWRSLFGKASRKDAGGQASDAQSTEGVRGEVADGAGEMLPNAAMIWSEGTKVLRTEGGGAEAAPGSGGREERSRRQMLNWMRPGRRWRRQRSGSRSWKSGNVRDDAAVSPRLKAEPGALPCRERAKATSSTPPRPRRKTRWRWVRVPRASGSSWAVS